MQPELIYCANGNSKRAYIAKLAGFKIGAQLPGTIYDAHKPLYFADQNWERPQYIRYIKALKKHRPVMASVLDIEEWRRLEEYIMRAEEISRFCQVVMLIPKINGIIKKLGQRFPDKKINDAEIRLGYSVPTPFGRTDVPTLEFFGWPVHLLGGSPLEQIKLCKDANLNVVSVDGNSHNAHANFGRFFSYKPVEAAKNKHWPTLREFFGERQDCNGPLMAFELSCNNIMAMWQQDLNQPRLPAPAESRAVDLSNRQGG